ncbi:synaptic plasticity regulator PANTS isoform X1 [Microcaecilia unicolor]|uniref:Synaptic plasticity regulator PANTS n=1 Tax=Microcaecilia unicolor TaxID=1415580 RepID=A0A6P7ZD22_9AMPH|nr:UPF0545 protein C22orf39 homolog isoform X1 [Microcaecilia unicolor]
MDNNNGTGLVVDISSQLFGAGEGEPPRACEDYWHEWKHCRSLKNLFHHYYTYGEAPSCQQWKADYSMCREWEKTRSTEAKDALRQSEKNRLLEKQKHVSVWNIRKSPPKDWYLPLDQGKPKE